MESNAEQTLEKKNLDIDISTSGNLKASRSETHSSRRAAARKGDISACSLSPAVGPLDSAHNKKWVCQNLACKAVLSLEEAFCKRCSCCICHQFDDNKDPTLWLVCGSESQDLDSCGMSCHVECAIQRQKAGVVNLGESLQIDGSYCCASCGKVSSILGLWKKQLVLARDARRVDILCHRISLSFRLLDGTSRFKTLHEVVSEAKEKLETEVGPVDGVSAKMARGIVSRLSVAGDVLKLCSLGIDKADEWLSSAASCPLPNGATVQSDSLPAACRFQFEDITSTTVVIALKDVSPSDGRSVEGYKLWYGESRERGGAEMEPVVFPRSQKRILVSNLRPCTEYAFKVISFWEWGDLGHSESKCFTRSVEVLRKQLSAGGSSGSKREEETAKSWAPSSAGGFKVRDLGKILRLAWVQERGGAVEFCGDSGEGGEDGGPSSPSGFAPCGLNLGVLSALGMNPELLAALGCSEAGEGSADRKSGGTSEDSHNWDDDGDDDVGARRRRRRAEEETEFEGGSTLVDGSPPWPSCEGRLDERYEDCVKVLRWLECEGHVGRDFRMKFLTWFSLRSTERERRVVHTYVDTLVDDPASLAGQLLDSFSGIVACKRPRNHGSCDALCAAPHL
ncbi:VIN3-like protein 1 [Wolffia australiana]